MVMSVAISRLIAGWLAFLTNLGASVVCQNGSAAKLNINECIASECVLVEERIVLNLIKSQTNGQGWV
jgi:hypothetical protein